MKSNKGISTSAVRTVAIIVALILGYQGMQLAKIARSLDQQIKETQKEVAIENKKVEALILEYENIESLQNVERVAREKLGLVKKDEIVFREKY